MSSCKHPFSIGAVEYKPSGNSTRAQYETMKHPTIKPAMTQLPSIPPHPGYCIVAQAGVETLAISIWLPKIRDVEEWIDRWAEKRRHWNIVYEVSFNGKPYARFDQRAGRHPIRVS